jgi:hypothetical protein
MLLTGLWRQPGFLTWWIARSISALGSQVTLLALPLTAVLVFGAGPAETGGLLAAETGAMLLVSLFVGVLVCRPTCHRLHVRGIV